MADETVILLSSDAKQFTVLKRVACMSKTLKDLLQDAADNQIPLPTVEGKILEKVVTFCTHHVDDPAPPAAAAGDEKKDIDPKPVEISTWDKEFTSDMDQETIFQLILAANYLDVRPLLELACRTVANSVLGKTPKEIYAMFKVEQELTPEEEEEVRKENPWLEDQ